MKSNGPVLEEQFDEEKAAYVKDLYGDSTSEKVADWLQDCAKEVCVQISKKRTLKAIIEMWHESCTRPVGERARELGGRMSIPRETKKPIGL